MKKVLFLIHTLLPGGAEKVLVNLVKTMDKTKYDITVMTIVNEGIYIKDIKQMEHVKYGYIFPAFFKEKRENKEKRTCAFYKKLMDSIWKIYNFFVKYFPKSVYKHKIKEKYDIEISFLEGRAAKIISHSANPSSKKIAWIHTDIIKNKNASGSFKNIEEERKCYQQFDKVVCVSKGVKEQFVLKTNIQNNVQVMLNPIDSDEILQKAKCEVTDMLKPNTFLICSVGRLIKEKGYDRLLRIHARLLQDNIPNVLWIIGEGEKRKELEAYITDNHLENSVTLLGFKSNPYQYMKMADLFVCSSRVEGLSTVVCEAGILGIPIVTTNCPGVAELFEKNKEAALVTENEEEALYQGIKKIITDSNLYLHYAYHVKHIQNAFMLEERVKEIEAIMDSL